MFATLREQFSPSLLAQVLQHVQLLIKLLGSAASAGLRDLSQPLTAMAGIVDVPSSTWDRPAAIQIFQAIHHPGKILDDGQITSGKIPQHAYAGLAVINRFEIIETQQVGKFVGIDLVAFVAMFEQSVLARVAHN
jgi:hypothetical protein